MYGSWTSPRRRAFRNVKPNVHFCTSVFLFERVNEMHSATSAGVSCSFWLEPNYHGFTLYATRKELKGWSTNTFGPLIPLVQPSTGYMRISTQVDCWDHWCAWLNSIEPPCGFSHSVIIFQKASSHQCAYIYHCGQAYRTTTGMMILNSSWPHSKYPLHVTPPLKLLMC